MRQVSHRKRLLQQKRFKQLLLLLLAISFFLSVAIVPLERSEGLIQTPFDGLWWAVTTLTSVGYGDFVPVTGAGKIVGMFLQIVGTMMFGIIIAIISTSMNKIQEEFYWNRLFERLNRMESEIQKLRKMTSFIVRDGQNNNDEEKKV